MPPIAYYIVAKGKDQTVKYEIRHSMVLLALKEGIKPTARHDGVLRNTSANGYAATGGPELAGCRTGAGRPIIFPRRLLPGSRGRWCDSRRS